MRKIIISILLVAVMVVPCFAGGVLDYIDPQLGTGWEFLQLKAPVLTGTARVFVGQGRLKGFNVRVGGLLGDGAKPGLLAGPSIDIAQVTRGKLSFVLDYAQADLSLLSGALYAPSEDGAEVEGLLCLAVTLVKR